MCANWGGREMNDKGEIEKGEEKAAGPLLLWTAGSQEGMQECRNAGTQEHRKLREDLILSYLYVHHGLAFK